MSLTNKTTLLNDAQLIRYAEKEGFNTAERIGKLFVDFINNVDSALVTEVSERKSADNVLQQQLTTTTSVANQALSTANSANTKATTANNNITALQGKIGKPGGIAPLDESGMVSASYLPSYMDDVVEFTKIEEGSLEGNVNLNNGVEGAYYSTDPGCEVIYYSYASCFMLKAIIIIRGEETINYYDTWLDSEKYQSTVNISNIIYK